MPTGSRMNSSRSSTIELRSPLNAITGWASLLRNGKLGDEQASRAIDTILRNAQAQNQLIGDLLDISRIVSGRMRLDIRPFQLIAVIEAALEVARPAAEAKAIRLETFLDPSAGPVAGDPDRLQQIFWNLLSNAIKFTPQRGRVQVRLQRINSHVEVVFSDNGRGIEPSLLPLIFRRFQQGDSSTTREHGGLGLGLAIVRHLVELHGGIVNARSNGPGEGAEFTVQLPLLPAGLPAMLDETRVHPTSGGGVSGPMPSLADLRILLVDDELEAREVVAAILTQAGAEVATAASVQEAMYLFGQWKPHVLISDIGMPNEDGYALIRKVRDLTSEEGGQVPAIALTAFARIQDRLQVLSAGYQMHVPKPVEPVEAATVVASVAKRL